MKRAVILAAMMAVLASTAAFGAVQDFGKFTVDLAEGWKTDQYYETVEIIKYAMFDVYGRDFMLIIMTGLEAAPEEMSAMLRSVNVK